MDSVLLVLTTLACRRNGITIAVNILNSIYSHFVLIFFFSKNFAIKISFSKTLISPNAQHGGQAASLEYYHFIV